MQRLTDESPIFQRLWTQHKVTGEQVRTKSYQHPEAGLLHLSVTHLHAGCRPEITVSTYTPANEETAARLRDALD